MSFPSPKHRSSVASELPQLLLVISGSLKPDDVWCQQIFSAHLYAMDEKGFFAMTIKKSMCYQALNWLGLDRDPAAVKPWDR
jgi:hypothetical protein